MNVENKFKQLTKDIGLIKSDLKEVKVRLQNLTTLDVETYEVRPEYMQKIKKLDKNGRFTPFKTIKDLRKETENV